MYYLKGTSKLFLDHCECCSSADCSIDLNCIKSQHHKSHCECCLTFSIQLVTDESYDTYIYQSDKFTTETTDWLDDQEELIAIRSWTSDEKTDFVDLMLKEYVLDELKFILRSTSNSVLLIC